MKFGYPKTLDLCNFIERWLIEIQNMPSCDLYVQFKTTFKFERYLTQLPRFSRAAFCRFRLNNTRLPIVLGRFTKTPRNLRLCTLCTNEELGNEFHFLFKCNHPQITSLRSNYIPSTYTDQPSIEKMCRTNRIRKHSNNQKSSHVHKEWT